MTSSVPLSDEEIRRYLEDVELARSELTSRQ